MRYEIKGEFTMGNELAIGSVGISVILSILLRMVYNTWDIPSKFKSWIAVGIGMVLALIGLYVTVGDVSAGTIAAYLVQGFMIGATATGIYELSKKA